MTRLSRTGLAVTAAVIASAPMMARQDAALKDLIPKGMVIGVAINQRQSDGVDAAAVDIITKQFNQITSENLLKFQPVHPAADRYTFDAQDRFVQFGVDRKMQVVGHTLVWHNQTGTWVFQGAEGKPADRETLLARMRDHIHTVVGRYKGKIHGWDVVNEAIDEDGCLRKTPWREGIGDDYVAEGVRIRARGRSERQALLQRVPTRNSIAPRWDTPMECHQGRRHWHENPNGEDTIFRHDGRTAWGHKDWTTREDSQGRNRGSRDRDGARCTEAGRPPRDHGLQHRPWRPRRCARPLLQRSCDVRGADPRSARRLVAGRISAGRSDALVSLIDLLPTLCDLTGVKAPADIDGVSLRPILDRRAARVQDMVFGEYYGKQSWRVPIRMVRTERWKYVRYLGYGEELYDLASDPGELRNLAREPRAASDRTRLARELEKWMRGTDDPFSRLQATDRSGRAVAGDPIRQ